MIGLKRQLLNSLRREDMANSPFHEAIKGYEQRRSQLFPDKRRIPGRKAKFFLGLSFCLQLFGIQRVIDIKKHFKRSDQQMQKLQRKSKINIEQLCRLCKQCLILDTVQWKPVMASFQSKIIMRRALFQHKGPNYYNDNIKNRFNQKDVWVPYQPRYALMYNKTNRQVKPYSLAYYQRYMSSYDQYNI